ncbi:cohesin domain-containing protein [Pseudomaricurvus alcaniphilus]|uniref:cohesin domain-containing protein n=1 Tax=Pseudomaricurvus alcaniphilus TaxID=1166482 RepID=UPI00140A9552|nr:cohesin domain-containing protein [Pseudomaricurvus alcaniphilus]
MTTYTLSTKRSQFGMPAGIASYRHRLMLLLCVLCPLLAAPASAIPILSVDADPSTAGIQAARSIEVGDSFSVDIWVSGLSPPPGLGGFDFTLLFDPSLVAATGVVSGGFFPVPLVLLTSLAPGHVRYAEHFLLSAPPAIEGLLATVSFDALSSGNNSFIVDSSLTELTNPFAVELVFGSAAATITITNPNAGTLPTPATGLLLVLGLLGLRLARRTTRCH